MGRGRHRAERVRPRWRGRAGGVVASLVVAGVVTGVVAVAVEAVMTLGTGTGTAAASSAVPVTLGRATGGADLRPGGRGTVRLVATSSAEAVVRLARLDLDTARGDGGFTTDRPGCPGSAFGFTAQDRGGEGWAVPARAGGVDGSLAIALPGAVSMTSTAPDACQGVTVTVHLRAGR